MSYFYSSSSSKSILKGSNFILSCKAGFYWKNCWIYSFKCQKEFLYSSLFSPSTEELKELSVQIESSSVKTMGSILGLYRDCLESAMFIFFIYIYIFYLYVFLYLYFEFWRVCIFFCRFFFLFFLFLGWMWLVLLGEESFVFVE